MNTFYARSLAVADILGLWLALLFATYLVGREVEGVRFLHVLEWRLSLVNLFALAALSVFWLLINRLCENYNELNLGWSSQLQRIGIVTLIGSSFIFVGGFLFGIRLFTPKFVVFFSLFYLSLAFLIRRIQMALGSFLDPDQRYIPKVIMVGSQSICARYRSQLMGSNDALIAGYFAACSNANWEVPHLGKVTDLSDYVSQNVVDSVFVGLELSSVDACLRSQLKEIQSMGIEVILPVEVLDEVLPLPENLQHRAHLRRWCLSSGNAAVVIALDSGPQMGWSLAIKRLIDISGALVAMALLAPLMIGIAIAIRLTMGPSVLFVQPRLGYHRRVIHVYKFRTMIANADSMRDAMRIENDRDGAAFKMRNDPRVTSLGRWLRRLNLDELPQLFNVLKGDMSLVGPRPLPLDDYARMDRKTYLRRLSVLPGITCSWQIGDRERISFDDWMRMDLDYIDHWSLATDLKLLSLTVWVVLTGRGDR